MTRGIDKATIVGESNPYGGSDELALYPAPDGCSGHRLCCLILGMNRRRYLESFSRTNLIQGKWTMKDARARARSLCINASDGDKFILLGSKVCKAFDLDFVPFTTAGISVPLCRRIIVYFLTLPHPSGLCRLWNEPDAFDKARLAVKEFCRPSTEPDQD